MITFRYNDCAVNLKPRQTYKYEAPEWLKYY